LKVLLLTTDSFGAHGGIALYNRDLIEALAALPEVSEVVVLPRNYTYEATLRFPSKISFVANAAGGKWHYVKTTLGISLEKFDLVICGHINLLPLAGAFAWGKEIPLVLMVYGIDVWKPSSRVTRLCLNRADAIWSISAITRDRMRVWSKLPIEKFEILPNAIHLDRYTVDPKRQDLMERYGIKERKVLLALGRLSAAEQYKGFDEVIDVMPELLKQDSSLVYLIAGDGDDRERLSEKVKLMGLTGNVIFTGFVPEDEKADHFRLADVFVMPGRGEGFGFVFLEALACGVPAIGSKIDGSREALLDGNLGELVDPDDYESIQEAILTALKKPKRLLPSLSYFAWPAFVDRLANATREVVSLR